jgi:hypothetical protein
VSRVPQALGVAGAAPLLAAGRVVEAVAR